jgi:hypothetical protein
LGPKDDRAACPVFRLERYDVEITALFLKSPVLLFLARQLLFDGTKDKVFSQQSRRNAPTHEKEEKKC